MQLAPLLQDPDVRRDLLGDLGLEPTSLAGRWLVLALTALLDAVGAAYNASLLTVLYLEARIRREGFDLWVQLERMQARALPSVPARESSGRSGPATSWEGLA